MRPVVPVVVLGVVVLAATCGSSYSDAVPDTLEVVLDGAQDLQRKGKDVRYFVSSPCPAEPTSKELTARFEAAGWIVVDRDPLDPESHGEHLRNWQPVPHPPGEMSAMWIGWFQKGNDLANVMLRCPQPESPDDPSTKLEVTIRRVTTDNLESTP